MSDLEDEYRKALARYPRAWRRDNEEALLGVLLDNAEAEGRQHMSKADHRDLAVNSRRIRTVRALPVALLTVAGLALLFLAVLVFSGTPVDGEIYFMPPAIPATPIGGSYEPLFLVRYPSWVLYAFTFGALVVATVAGLLLVRRNSRADRAA